MSRIAARSASASILLVRSPCPRSGRMSAILSGWQVGVPKSAAPLFGRLALLTGRHFTAVPGTLVFRPPPRVIWSPIPFRSPAGASRASRSRSCPVATVSRYRDRLSRRRLPSDTVLVETASTYRRHQSRRASPCSSCSGAFLVVAALVAPPVPVRDVVPGDYRRCWATRAVHTHRPDTSDGPR